MLFRELPTRLDWIGSVVRRWVVRKPVVYLVARLYVWSVTCKCSVQGPWLKDLCIHQLVTVSALFHPFSQPDLRLLVLVVICPIKQSANQQKPDPDNGVPLTYPKSYHRGYKKHPELQRIAPCRTRPCNLSYRRFSSCMPMDPIRCRLLYQAVPKFIVPRHNGDTFTPAEGDRTR